MNKAVNVALLDDHTLFLKGMVLLIKEALPEAEVSTFKSLSALLAEVELLSTLDLLISDVELPGEDIFSGFEKIKQINPKLPILIISMHEKLAVVRNCRLLGIEGYILKDEDALLLPAITSIMEGKPFYSPRIASLSLTFEPLLNQLTRREVEVMMETARGLTNKEIADKLLVSIETVKTHKKNIKLKLEISSTQELINYAKKTYLL